MIDSSAVYSDTVRIHAPAAFVWAILTDFENYEKWNAFCPSIKTRLELGAPVEMMTDLGSGLQPQVEYMSRIEAPNVIAWSMENRPEDPIHACRTQFINAVSDDCCLYVSIDDFGGPGMAGMLAHFGKAVEDGFNRCAYGLKDYAEKQYAAKNSSQ